MATRFLHNLSLRRKQMLIIILTSGLALLLACLVFLAHDRMNFQRDLVDNISVLATVTGDHCAPAIQFNDPKAATETLGTLRANGNITCACIYNPAGDVFAIYQRQAGTTFVPPSTPAAASESFAKNQLNLFRPIQWNGRTMGTIFIASDLNDYANRMMRCVGTTGVVFVAALLVALLLSSRLQQVISDPILQLAQVARSVALNKNYSVRVKLHANDELGPLVDGFNAMLEQIQARDAALQAGRDSLEQRIKERTKELAESLSMLHATLESTADGILTVDLTGRVTSCNKKYINLWQFDAGQIERRDVWEMRRHAAQRVKNPEEFLRRIEIVEASPETEFCDLVELKDGRIFERSVFPQRLDGACVGMVIHWRDITGRKRAEAELAYERDLLRALLDNSPDHIYFKDRESRFIKAGVAMARLFGQNSPDELVGRTDFDFFAEEHARQAFEDEQNIIRTGQPIVGKVEKESWNSERKTTWVLTNKIPLRDKTGAIIGTFGISKDITAMKETEAKLDVVHKQLLEISRQAGMAEVATGVLHNVGNVLNSVNVSTTVVLDTIKKSRVNNLGRLAGMVSEHKNNLPAFFTDNPQGRQFPDYLLKLTEHLAREQADLIKEVELTRQHIEHIKDIVAMQQSYAKVCGVAETVKIVDLVEDALRMNAGALIRHDVRLIRDYADNLPLINVDKHKVMQILVNLIRNAKYACDDSGRTEKQVTVQLRRQEERIQIAVIDNGIGILPENMNRIFNHGFTTRKDGHGFGLHSGALAAKELGGTLKVHSDGLGAGAKFTLDLPLQPPQKT